MRSISFSVVVTVVLCSSPVLAQGSLGALCSEASPCADGLTCRDGFCLRIANEAPPPAAEPPAAEPPAAEPPTTTEPPAAEPPTTTEPPAAAPVPTTTEPPAAAPAPTTTDEPEPPVEEAVPADPATPAATPEPPSAQAPDVAADEKAEPAPPAVADQLAPVTSTPDKSPGLSPAQAKERAEDASGAVWGGAGGRALAVPALACGSCLFGAGVCTTLGARRFVDAGARGDFPDVGSNEEAELGGNIATGIGVVMAAAGVPILIVGEGAVIYSAFTDWVPCSSGFALEDAGLITLGVTRALVWLIGSQLGALGAGLCAGGVWAIAVSDAGSSFDLDGEAISIFRGLGRDGSLLASVGAIPLGLGCVLGVLAAGLDLGTLLRAGALEEEASERALTVGANPDVTGAGASPRFTSSSTAEPAAARDMAY